MVQQKKLQKNLHYTLMVPLVCTRTGGCFSYKQHCRSVIRIPIGKVSSVKTELEHPPFVGKQLEDDMAISIYFFSVYGEGLS